MVGAVRYLVKERGLPVTIHQLFLVYGMYAKAIRENEKLIRELAQEITEEE